MDFTIPEGFSNDLKRFKAFLETNLEPHLARWYRDEAMPRDFLEVMGRNGWLGFAEENGRIVEQPALRQALLFEHLATVSPGVAVAVLVQISLGTAPLFLFGSERLKQSHLSSAMKGESLLCLGNTEHLAGSDVAGIAMRAEEVEDGWLLNGTKAYVTNGAISDMAVVTAVSDPEAARSRRISMFLVDLASAGVKRRKLNKRVWIPSDLTRLHFDNVFVPEENLVGYRGRGLAQVLATFSQSRIPIGALTLGTAMGAFQAGLDRARQREIFGRKIVDFQAKAFEIADFYTRIEAARLLVWKACWRKDQGKDSRMEASMAKYLTVEVARQVGVWASDLFGAVSVIQDHPVHKYPMDAWASSLGEGTQDVQKLIIFREIMKKENRSTQ